MTDKLRRLAAEATFQVEVTVTAFLMKSDGTVLNDDVADATLGFGARVAPSAVAITDATVQAALTKGLGPVLAAIRLALTSYGMAYLGEIDEPIKDTASLRDTGVRTQTAEVRIRVPMGSGPEAKA